MVVLGMRRLWKYQRYILILILLSFVLGMVIGMKLLPSQIGQDFQDVATRSILLNKLKMNDESHLHKPPLVGAPVGVNMLQRDEQSEIKFLNNKNNHTNVSLEFQDSNSLELSYDVHAFYYVWYGNPSHDGKYLHWNHEYLPHWNAKLAGHWRTGYHNPPDDIGANFYPQLGSYSSQDKSVIEEHMKQLQTAGVGVISVSWYPPEQADQQGYPFDFVVPLLLDAAQHYSIKVCIHIEPYQGRDAATLRTNLQYIHTNYGSHPAYYRRRHKNKMLPMFYVYDSYNQKKEEWARIFTLHGDLSIRNTDLDGIFIGLLVEAKHRHDLVYAGFDGFYTYFASSGFSYGSNSNNWKNFAREAVGKGLIFIPSVGPGYVDDRIRPWNTINTKERNDGQYYENYFIKAVNVNPPIISITSFNEWHEGSQIEKAVSKQYEDYKYLDYSPNNPDFYLSLTKKWILKFRKHKKHNL